jgi:23S rRNA (adenine2503-C2)-methyltransferase
MNFEKLKTPTGHICIMQGEQDMLLEFLSLGDYGKDKNIKADFMGMTNEINGVPHGELMPLEEKWVITISSQYGCSMGCNFCDVPKVRQGINATFNDLINQVKNALSLHPEVKTAKRINLHYARMGEPTFNDAVIESAYCLKGYFDKLGWGFHPVVSTIMPFSASYSEAQYDQLRKFINKWILLKNRFNGEAGLQISINTTDEPARTKTMPRAYCLDVIADMLKIILKEQGLKGRKIALNFALTDDPIDADILRSYFDPRYFMCKITPMHLTNAVIKNGKITDNGYDYYYPYKQAEENLKAAGFDVLVFIPSKEEDESRITCGNAILADRYKQ